MRLTIPAFFARRKKLARKRLSLKQFFFVPTLSGSQKASEFYPDKSGTAISAMAV
jgi:hypothetical protein